MSFRATIILALGAAGLSSILPFIVGMSTANFGGALELSIVLAVVWFVASVYAIRRFRKPGWWTMLGLIPSLLWPYWMAAVTYACAVHQSCL
jgi:hypothetical protein